MEKIRDGARTSIFFNGSIGVATGVFLVLMIVGGDYAGSAVNDIVEIVTVFPFDAKAFWTLFAALFAIMNPLVALPYFVELTKHMSGRQRRRLALVCAATVMVALVVAALFGREILGFFAISVSSFRIAGGIIVLLMGLSLMNAKGSAKSDHSPESARASNRESEAICPLAIPLLAGPGAIATIILQCEGAQQPGDFVTIGTVIGSMVVVTYVVLRVAVPVARIVGQSGLMVSTRLIGMVVAAIAIDMMVIGIRAILA